MRGKSQRVYPSRLTAAHIHRLTRILIVTDLTSPQAMRHIDFIALLPTQPFLKIHRLADFELSSVT
ncbi:hypothetical protein J1614_003741 [Plenodomus biglobosus]|nr:hypothetical protein J1614_003741 [Plenodomus biglobosus]